jgi:hypothetical protein
LEGVKAKGVALKDVKGAMNPLVLAEVMRNMPSSFTEQDKVAFIDDFIAK